MLPIEPMFSVEALLLEDLIYITDPTAMATIAKGAITEALAAKRANRPGLLAPNLPILKAPFAPILPRLKAPFAPILPRFIAPWEDNSPIDAERPKPSLCLSHGKKPFFSFFSFSF